MRQVSNRIVFGRNKFTTSFNNTIFTAEAGVGEHTPTDSISRLVDSRIYAVLLQSVSRSEATGAGAALPSLTLIFSECLVLLEQFFDWNPIFIQKRLGSMNSSNRSRN